MANTNNQKETAEDKALERFTEMMIERVKEIQTDWQKPWISETATVWPKNLSGREYSGMNALMLMMHCEKEGYKLPIFLTFDRIIGLNYGADKQGTKHQLTDKEGNNLPHVSLIKGSKSFPVFITTFTCVHAENREKIRYDEYKQLSDEDRKQYNVYPKLQVYNVFNIDQTNIKEARPELYEKLLSQNRADKPKVQEGERFNFAPLDKMIKDGSWFCPIKEVKGDDAYYSISKDEIIVPLRTSFIDGESFVSNTFHEMTHSLGAESRLNRLKPSSFGSKEYAKEELTAELTAAAISCKYGITKHIKEDSAAYLKSWLGSMKESPDYLKSVLLDVKRSSLMMSQRIDEVRQEIENGANVGLPDYQYGDYALIGEAIAKNKEAIEKGLRESGMYTLRSVTLMETSDHRRMQADIKLTGTHQKATVENLSICTPTMESYQADAIMDTLHQAGLSIFDIPYETMKGALMGNPSALVDIQGTMKRLTIQKQATGEYDIKISAPLTNTKTKKDECVMEGIE